MASSAGRPTLGSRETTPLMIDVQWDRAGMSRVDRFLGGYEGVQLERRMTAAMLKELRPLAAKIRVAERASGIHNRSGRHVRSIRVTRPRGQTGEIVFSVGPHDRIRHLLIRGHRIVTPGGRDTGRRSQAFDYVGPVISAEMPQLMGKLGSDVWQGAVGGTLMGVF